MNEKQIADHFVALALASEGKIALAALVERMVPIADLRELARLRGLAPKGFRIDKAPAKALAEVLVDVRNSEVLEEVCAFLAKALVGAPEPVVQPGPASATDLRPMLELREHELGETRSRLEAALLNARRQSQREDEAQLLLQREQEALIRARNEIDALRRKLDAAQSTLTPSSEVGPRIRDLERSLEEADIVEEALRRRLAEQQTKVQSLVSEVTELEQLLPKGRRRRAPPPVAKPVSERIRLPYFTPAFYRSLADKDRRAMERAFSAVHTLCTEGPGYPGLEVKQLEGMGLWSMRAALKLRVYFRWRQDGDVEIEELADREDQHTTLKRLKDR